MINELTFEATEKNKKLLKLFFSQFDFTILHKAFVNYDVRDFIEERNNEKGIGVVLYKSSNPNIKIHILYSIEYGVFRKISTWGVNSLISSFISGYSIDEYEEKIRSFRRAQKTLKILKLKCYTYMELPKKEIKKFIRSKLTKNY